MSGIGTSYARQKARSRRQFGTTILLQGGPFPCFTEEAATDKVGLGFLSRLSLGTYSARADGRLFDLSPSDFAPTTSVPRPPEGAVGVWEGRVYRLTHVTAAPVGGVDAKLLCYGHRVLMLSQISAEDLAWLPGAVLSATSTVFETEACQLWRPKSLPQLVEAATLNVKDMTFERAGDAATFFVPMTPGEKVSILGQFDVRVDHIFTDVALKLGDLLYRPDADEAWHVKAPSEVQPGSGLNRAVVRHLQVVPKSVRDGQD